MAAPFKRRTAATFARDILLFTRLRAALQMNHVLLGEGAEAHEAEEAIGAIDKVLPHLIRLRRMALDAEQDGDDGIAA